MMGASFWAAAGAVSGFVGVALGAFGAHGLKDRLDAHALEVYQTAAHYQMIHALALIALGAWLSARATAGLGALAGAGNIVGWCFLVGTVVFSGSLYALAVSGVKTLGAITPIGGVLFLIGWAAFARLAIRG
jgi:uncharacterized membrane protein YgdD (TMEM256/DUF423 family)